MDVTDKNITSILGKREPEDMAEAINLFTRSSHILIKKLRDSESLPEYLKPLSNQEIIDVMYKIIFV